MQQYNIPQFVDSEDKIFGPITIRQFAVLAIGVVIGGFLVGKSFATKIMLPIALITMHMSWGLGFLTSSKRGLRRG